MNPDLPFTKERLLKYDRDSLVSLAKYHGIKVKQKYTNQDIVDKLWEKYYPVVVICGHGKAVRCERNVDANGDEIIIYEGKTYNLSRMGVRAQRALAGRMGLGE